MLLIKLFCLCTLLIINVRATTHWMVTENGLIQPRVGAPFEMARPYDLLAFLNQDTRWEKIINLYHDLKSRKQVIRRLWSYIQRDCDLDAKIQNDNNCLKASPLTSIDWYSSELDDGKNHGNIPFYYYRPTKIHIGEDIDVPDCKKISSLTFSMHSFEHLEGMVQRQNLSADAEYMYFSFGPFENVNQYGHWVARSLRRNSSSWVHYNMASLYWRAQGNAPKAMECSRRAVHYAPREHKDIALLSMGSILLRSNKIEDAIIILGAAFDHAPGNLLNNYVLGNAFAISGNYNLSLKLFAFCEKINPDVKDAAIRKYGILCHMTLQERILLLEQYMTKFRSELTEFAQIEAHWLKSQAAFLRNMHHNEKFDYTNIEKNCQKMSELTGLDIKSLKKEGDRNSFIQYILDGPLYTAEWLQAKGVHAIKSFYKFMRVLQHIDRQLSEVSDYVKKPILMMSDDNNSIKETNLDDFMKVSKGKPNPEGKDKSKNNQADETHKYEAGLPLYPSDINVDRKTQDFDVEIDWPTANFCKKSASQFPKDLNTIYPVFLPFENKGIRLLTVLSKKIGVPVDAEHDLPWHPPTCANDKESFSIKKSQKMQLTNDIASTQSLKHKLLEYVSDGNVNKIKHLQETEIGHRIFSAIQLKVAPKWILYTIASLYWRVRNHNVNAVTCLLMANKTVPARHRDIVLTSLASVYLEIGYFNDALIAAEKAFHVNRYEPSTNLVLAQLNMVMKHINAQLYHLKQVLRVEPLYMEGLVRNIFNAWACNSMTDETQVSELYSDNCKMEDSAVNIECNDMGLNCRVTNIHCLENRETNKEPIDRSSEILKMMTNSDAVVQLDDITMTSCVGGIRRLLDPYNHRKNYEKMRAKLNSLLSECGPDGCLNLEDFKEEDCGYQNLQISYWLHIVSFRQLIADAQLRLPPEIVTLTPSSKKIPECSFAELVEEHSKDFFFIKLNSLNVEEWEHLSNVKQLISELFDYFDYVTLGAKIAKYVEDNPHEWMGLLAASWWCGAGGHGDCSVKCITAAYLYAPLEQTRVSFLSIAAITHLQSKLEDAKDIAYLMFYLSPKSKVEAYMVAVAHTYMSEYQQAIWMYRYALSIDENFLPAKESLHATMCLMFLGEKPNSNYDFNFNVIIQTNSYS